MTLTSTQGAADFIARREPFTTSGAMSARYVRWMPSTGRLPADEIADLADLIEENREHGEETYVVFSYGTPIAWATLLEDLVVPDVRYSVTTSKHQSVCRRGA